MSSLIKMFGVKLNVFICDIENRKFKYFKYLKSFWSEIEINVTLKLVENINIPIFKYYKRNNSTVQKQV